MSRLLFVWAQGGVCAEMVDPGPIVLPVVAVAAIVGRHYPPPISEITMRRIAFVILAQSVHYSWRRWLY